MLMFEDLIRTKSSHMQNKRAHAHTCTVAHRRINSFIYTQICCYSSAVLWAPQRLWWCEKALEAPTGLLPNGRVDIYPRWLWLLLRQKWFNLLCWIQRNLFWWMERATAKEPEMHVCARCTLIYQRTASGATVTCFIWSLCWQWSRIVHEVSSRHVCWIIHTGAQLLQKARQWASQNHLPPHQIRPDWIPLSFWQSHIVQTFLFLVLNSCITECLPVLTVL